MTINRQTGIITFTADQMGLYAFSVKCTEYRNGLAIGSVQRDFQLEVLTCEGNNPPSFTLTQSGVDVADGATVELTRSGDRCFEVKATDKISGTNASSTTLTFEVISSVISSSDVTITPATGTETSDTDTLTIKVCFAGCFSTANGASVPVYFVLKDNGCPNGLMDTLKVKLKADPISQIPPQISTTLPENNASLKIGDELAFNVMATQPEQQDITIHAAGRDFDMTAAEMKFTNDQTGIGALTVPFNWKLLCSGYQHRTGNDFVIDFIASVKNSCSSLYDSVTVQLNVRDTVIDYDSYLPYNIITPNGDGFNDAYQLPDLPGDNCDNTFERCLIINRWGQVVFESTSRDFSWSGKDHPTGQYYYLVQYTNKRYKGWLGLVR